jgi:hypothetical protein
MLIVTKDGPIEFVGRQALGCHCWPQDEHQS